MNNEQKKYLLPDGCTDHENDIDHDVNDFSEYTNTQQNIYNQTERTYNEGGDGKVEGSNLGDGSHAEDANLGK